MDFITNRPGNFLSFKREIKTKQNSESYLRGVPFRILISERHKRKPSKLIFTRFPRNNKFSVVVFPRRNLIKTFWCSWKRTKWIQLNLEKINNLSLFFLRSSQVSWTEISSVVDFCVPSSLAGSRREFMRTNVLINYMRTRNW